MKERAGKESSRWGLPPPFGRQVTCCCAVERGTRYDMCVTFKKTCTLPQETDIFVHAFDGYATGARISRIASSFLRNLYDDGHRVDCRTVYIAQYSPPFQVSVHEGFSLPTSVLILFKTMESDVIGC